MPELASRAHQQNILPVVAQALEEGGVTVGELDAVAFTRGPGLLGLLLVGTSFAKGVAIAYCALIEVNHLQGHILSHFIRIAVGNIGNRNFLSFRYSSPEDTHKLLGSMIILTLKYLVTR